MGHQVYILKTVVPRNSDIAPVGNKVYGFGYAKLYITNRRMSQEKTGHIVQRTIDGNSKIKRQVFQAAFIMFQENETVV